MGKMKEIFIQQQEEKELTPDYPDEPDMCSNKSPQILCPNCNKAMLDVDFATNEATCYRCGQDFVKVGKNTVKYK
jgi:uncharacterized protein (DUF983 family)